MARTRAGLSGRPTCRPGVICPGLSAPQGWPLAAMSAGLPVGTLRPCLTSAVDQPRAASAALRSLLSGQRPAGVAFLSWLLVFMALVPHWCPVLAVVVVPPCAACRASTKCHGRRPSIYREGEPTEGWGNPEGVPRSQTALRRSIFRSRLSYPRFWPLQLQVISIGKELQEHLTGLGGGRSIAKRGGRSNAETPIRGGRSIALGGGDLSWINWRIHRAYPQSGPVWDAFRCAFRW